MYIIIYYTNYSRIIGLLEENINSILNCLGKDINDEIYKNSLKTLFVVGMGDQQFIAIINGGLLNLYSNIWSIFESSINSLFGIIFPEKDSKKKDEEFLNICNILGVSYKEVGNEDKEKIIKKLKDYPFTNKLGSIIALCGSYKSKYEEDDKKLLDNIYQIRNSQHSRGVGKNGEIKK